MKENCFLLCEKCKKETFYEKGTKNVCSFCAKEFHIEEGVCDLVIALNNAGIVTIASCGGHKDGFDQGKRTYPCVVLSKKYESLMEIIKDYKEKTGEEFITSHQKTLSGWKNFLLPKETSRNLKENRRSALLLAKHITNL